MCPFVGYAFKNKCAVVTVGMKMCIILPFFAAQFPQLTGI